MVQQKSTKREERQKLEDESKVPPRYVDPRLRRKFPTKMSPEIRNSAKVK